MGEPIICAALWRIDESRMVPLRSSLVAIHFNDVTSHRRARRARKRPTTRLLTHFGLCERLQLRCDHRRIRRGNFAVLPRYKNFAGTRNPSVRAYKPVKSDRISRPDGRTSECRRKLFLRMGILQTHFKIGKRNSLPRS